MFSFLKRIMPGYQTNFIVDCRKHSDLNDPRAIKIDEEKLSQWKIFSINDWGWRCGDYFYFALRDAVEADYYWLLEPDVGFYSRNDFNIFKETESLTDDFLAVYFGKRNELWSWHKSVSDFFPDVLGCSFPLTRCSGNLIDLLLNGRRMLSSVFSVQKPKTPWPNDEAFVASFVHSLGMSACTLEKIFPDQFKMFGTKDQYLAGPHLDNNGIVHPQLDLNSFRDKFNRRFGDALRAKRLDLFLRNSLTGVSSDLIGELLAPKDK